jgi:hypothetical protein
MRIGALWSILLKAQTRLESARSAIAYPRFLVHLWCGSGYDTQTAAAERLEAQSGSQLLPNV